MSNKAPSNGFKAGNTHAADNNNQKKKRIRKSPLRKTEAEIKKLEPQAIKNIEDSINGVEIEKDRVATSKWIVNTLVTLRKAVTIDEAEQNALRWEADRLGAEEEEAEKEEQPQARFSLVQLPVKKDLE